MIILLSRNLVSMGEAVVAFSSSIVVLYEQWRSYLGVDMGGNDGGNDPLNLVK